MCAGLVEGRGAGDIVSPERVLSWGPRRRPWTGR
jgi:hypothetical protein